MFLPQTEQMRAAASTDQSAEPCETAARGTCPRFAISKSIDVRGVLNPCKECASTLTTSISFFSISFGGSSVCSAQKSVMVSSGRDDQGSSSDITRLIRLLTEAASKRSLALRI